MLKGTFRKNNLRIKCNETLLCENIHSILHLKNSLRSYNNNGRVTWHRTITMNHFN